MVVDAVGWDGGVFYGLRNSDTRVCGVVRPYCQHDKKKKTEDNKPTKLRLSQRDRVR